MHYHIEYHRGGTMLQKFGAPLVYNAPSRQVIRAHIDTRLHKAIARANWAQDPVMTNVMRKDLV